MNLTELTTIDNVMFTHKGLCIPDDISEEAFLSNHKTVMLCRASARLWLRDSRAYASARWGVEWIADAELQMELDLGLPEPKTEKPALNPKDKSRAIVTIEGICQSFALWQRKMAPEIERWDRDRLTKALALVEPIEAQAKRIRELLEE